MNIDGLLKKYFSNSNISPSIEVFDKDSIHPVYTDIVNLLKSYPDIELSLLQALSYCFYEVLDNVLTHSEKLCGTVIMRYQPNENIIQVLVADDGIGVHKSLTANPNYTSMSEEEAVASCINDKVTDGKGMGFGLYCTSRLIKNAGIKLEIHSCKSVMSYNGEYTQVYTDEHWQGTIVYFELHSNKDIDPNDVVENRTNCVEQFDDEFINTDEFDNLW